MKRLNYFLNGLAALAFVALFPNVPAIQTINRQMLLPRLACQA